MVYKRFYINIIFRILLLLIFIGGFVYFLVVETALIRSAFMIIPIALIAAEMIRYVNRSNNDFKSFLDLLENNDFTTAFYAKGKGSSFEGLYATFNSLSKKYHSISTEKEAKHRHLLTLLQNIDIGIISFNSQNKIQMINPALMEMLKLPNLSENQDLTKLGSTLEDDLQKLMPGRNKLLKLKVEEQDLHLSLQVNLYKIKEEEFKLVSVKNIHSELDQREVESYQKLIRVLTHEIMNSITPISSLSNTLNDLLNQQNLEINDELMHQVKEGIDAIQNRSSNLLGFTKKNKKLTRLPNPAFEAIDLKNLLRKTVAIVQSFPGTDNITFQSEMMQEITISADPQLIEQVLVNIYKNAIDVLGEVANPIVSTNVYPLKNNKVEIAIADNGPGMNNNTLEKAFIPFFTTKSEGSGIGLSLCKQIVTAHHGMIKIDSNMNKGTRVSIFLLQ